MHAIFIPYGKQENVNFLLRDMAAQKLTLRLFKEGEPDKYVVIDCQLRILPLGIYEFVFPREHVDIVLTSLRFHLKDEGHYSEINRDMTIFGFKFNPFDYARKFLRIEEIPEFKSDKGLFWMDMHTGIIPIGIRHDKDITEPLSSQHAGWTHEAI